MKSNGKKAELARVATPSGSSHFSENVSKSRAEKSHHSVRFQGNSEPMSHCHAARDGDCIWEHCPQSRDNEPKTSGRSCPLKWFDYPTDTELEDCQ